MPRLRKNSKPYNILKYTLISGGVLFISILSPSSGALIVKELAKQYFYNKKIKKERFLQDLKRLQNRELINYEELSNRKIKITLTKLGKNKILTYNLENLKLKNKKWDKKWRLIVFDIPNYQKKARETLRKKLKELGFYPVQKSVFIIPYHCEDEIDFICSVFDINRNNVLIFEISNFEGVEKMKHHFGL